MICLSARLCRGQVNEVDAPRRRLFARGRINGRKADGTLIFPTLNLILLHLLSLSASLQYILYIMPLHRKQLQPRQSRRTIR